MQNKKRKNEFLTIFSSFPLPSIFVLILILCAGSGDIPFFVKSVSTFGSNKTDTNIEDFLILCRLKLAFIDVLSYEKKSLPIYITVVKIQAIFCKWAFLAKVQASPP